MTTSTNHANQFVRANPEMKTPRRRKRPSQAAIYRFINRSRRSLRPRKALLAKPLTCVISQF